MSLNWWKGIIIQECKKYYGIDPSRLSIEPAKIYGEITLKQLDDLMPKEWVSENGVTHKTRRGGFDSKYYLTTVNEMRRFLAWDMTQNAKAYSLEDFDCDDFAAVLWGRMKMWTSGLCHGILIIPGHAKNFFISADKKIYEIEPQSDRIVALTNPVTEYIL